MRILAREAAAAMNENANGVFRRRLTDEHVLDIYLVSDRLQGTVVLEVGQLPTDIRLPEIELGDVLDVQLLKDMHVLKINLLLENFSDVFFVLVDDLIDVTIKAQGAEAGGVALVQRLRRWERLLEGAIHGLSKSAQKGLIGELVVLKTLSAEIGVSRAVEAWFGPEAGVRDFEIESVGIEVKTTAGKGPLSVKISSERQLELIVIKQLFLWCLSIEKVAVGMSLNSAVDELRTLIGNDVFTLELYNKKLMQVGYLEIDRNRYQSQYAVRNEFIYQITDQFPSITSADIEDCVCDVCYRIMLDGCSSWKIEKEKLFKALMNV
jgi:hypothetical protein